jgi:hypothetical protein
MKQIKKEDYNLTAQHDAKGQKKNWLHNEQHTWLLAETQGQTANRKDSKSATLNHREVVSIGCHLHKVKPQGRRLRKVEPQGCILLHRPTQVGTGPHRMILWFHMLAQAHMGWFCASTGWHRLTRDDSVIPQGGKGWHRHAQDNSVIPKVGTGWYRPTQHDSVIPYVCTGWSRSAQDVSVVPYIGTDWHSPTLDDYAIQRWE